MVDFVKPTAEPTEGAVSAEGLQKAEELVQQEEGAANKLVGWAATIATAIAVAMTLFHLYAAVAGSWPFTGAPIIATQPLRYAHVAFPPVTIRIRPAAFRRRRNTAVPHRNLALMQTLHAQGITKRPRQLFKFQHFLCIRLFMNAMQRRNSASQ